MPKLEYNGIVARAGAYRYKWGTEIKTWEELRKAAQRTPSLMLTLGHPMNPDGTPRIPNKDDYLGRVDLIINDTEQRIDGKFKIHDEEWDKVPDHLKEALEKDKSVPISMGFPPPRMENGEQHDILWDHAALLGRGETPICPLGECGVNVRWESDDGEQIIMIYEQSTETKESEESVVTDETPEKPAEPRAVTAEDLDRFKSDILSSVKELLQPQEAAGAEPVETTPVDVEEPPAPTRPEPTLEPPRAFPTGSKSTVKDYPHMKDDGSVNVPMDVYLGKTKNKDTK